MKSSQKIRMAVASRPCARNPVPGLLLKILAWRIPGLDWFEPQFIAHLQFIRIWQAVYGDLIVQESSHQLIIHLTIVKISS